MGSQRVGHDCVAFTFITILSKFIFKNAFIVRLQSKIYLGSSQVEVTSPYYFVTFAVFLL